MDSSNGVYVNDARISECVPEDNDVIDLGKNCLIQCGIAAKDAAEDDAEDEAEILRVMQAMRTDSKTERIKY